MSKPRKKVGKSLFFIVLAFIVALTSISFFGVKSYYGDNEKVYFKGASDIRWGIDIQGGVEAVFSPETDKDVSENQLEAAKETINNRLINLGVTDYETSIDTRNDQIIVRFPWQSGEKDFDAASAVNELGETAVLTFCEGSTYDKDKVVLVGSTDIQQAAAVVMNGEHCVELRLTSAGRSKFATATAKNINKQIAICMDGQVISAPKVNTAITNGVAYITGQFTYEECASLASKINSGSLPFKLTVDDSKLQIISPTLGAEALNTMTIAGIIAFAIICLLIIVRYRLLGAISCVALAGQIGGIIACVSGFFAGSNSFTLTIPGIAGIILSIGIGIDANVIINERIREEIRSGKTVSGAINDGFRNATSAIIDGNITNVIVAVVLMGCFGPAESFFAKIFSPALSLLFGSSVSGAVYSFGYTQVIGIIFNFIMGVFASRLMLKSLANFKCMRNPWLYGGTKEVEEKKINFTGNFKRIGAVAVALVLVGVIVSAVFGPVLDITFSGGTKISYSYTGDIDTDEVKALADKTLDKTTKVDTTSGVSDQSQKLVISLADKAAVSAEKIDALSKALDKDFADNKPVQAEVNSVNATVGSIFFLKCLVAVAIAAILVVLYVGWRFRKIGGWTAGLSALIALVFDVLIAFFAAVIFRLEIDANFIAVVMTLLGYSLNNTIVVFDRIRENRRVYGDKMPVEELVDLSNTQVLSRNIVTTVTTVIAILTVFVVCQFTGISSLNTLTVPLIFGLISGTLSSICLAPSLWVVWKNRKADNKKA